MTSERETPPPDDMMDTAVDNDRYPFLKHVLPNCHDGLLSTYCGANDNAIAARPIHRRWVRRAAVMAVLAIVIAVLQLAIGEVFEPQGHLATLVGLGLSLLELGLILLATIAFFRGRKWRAAWLTERHRAERCRFLKFKSVISPEFWSVARSDECSPTALAEYDRVTQITSKSMNEWLDHDELPQPPGRIALPPGERLEPLRDYYVEKRLQHQIDYFWAQSSKRTRGESFASKLPAWIFAVSVIVVAVHAGMEVTEWFRHRGNTTEAAQPNVAGAMMVLATAALFAFGSGIRTMRTAEETPRNRNRFQAKYLALWSIGERLKAAAARDEQEAEILLRDLWCAEQIMIAEHREWLRLMKDAEWEW